MTLMCSSVLSSILSNFCMNTWAIPTYKRRSRLIVQNGVCLLTSCKYDTGVLRHCHSAGANLRLLCLRELQLEKEAVSSELHQDREDHPCSRNNPEQNETLLMATSLVQPDCTQFCKTIWPHYCNPRVRYHCKCTNISKHYYFVTLLFRRFNHSLQEIFCCFNYSLHKNFREIYFCSLERVRKHLTTKISRFSLSQVVPQ